MNKKQNPNHGLLACTLRRRYSEASRHGSALLIATILLFVVLSMVVSLTYVTVMEQKMSSKTKSSVGSFFNADSGIEWALNQIANGSGRIDFVFSGIDAATGKKTCPDFGSGSPCDIYLLDSAGKVINSANPNSITTVSDISEVKAVRSIGTNNTGEVTQRAIEAAVAAGGGGCYTQYVTDPYIVSNCGGNVNNCACLAGFTNKGTIGDWGACGNSSFFRGDRPAVPGPVNGTNWLCDLDEWYVGRAYVCCQ